ncbi:hypothetical protein niasHT_034680 [Heterodera trifolii]|uniref:Uncharacterized protein n=1 Tax=Heterodera trifolii TaxID=157864 RepID=A0ABD2IQS7_9BILA
MEHKLYGVFASSQTLRFFLIPRLNKWAEIRLIVCPYGALTEAHSTYEQIENAFTYLSEENLASATPPAPTNSAETSVASVHTEPTYEQPPSVLPKDGTNAQQQLNLSDRSSVSPLKVAVDTSGSVVPSRIVHPTEDVEQRKRDVPTRPTVQPPKPPTNAERPTSQSVGGGRDQIVSSSFKNPLNGTESRIRKPTEFVWQGSHIPSPPKSNHRRLPHNQRNKAKEPLLVWSAHLPTVFRLGKTFAQPLGRALSPQSKRSKNIITPNFPNRTSKTQRKRRRPPQFPFQKSSLAATRERTPKKMNVFQKAHRPIAFLYEAMEEF